MAAITSFTYKGVRYYAEDSNRVLRKDEVRTKDGEVVKVVSALDFHGNPFIEVRSVPSVRWLFPFDPPGDVALQRAWWKLYKFRPGEHFDEEKRRVVKAPEPFLRDMEFVHEGKVCLVVPSCSGEGWFAAYEGNEGFTKFVWSRVPSTSGSEKLRSLREALITFLHSKGLQP